MISFGGSGRHFREILVGRRHSWQQLSVSLWVQKLRFTSKWIHNYFSFHNVTAHCAQWVYNLTIWLYNNFTAFFSVHSGFRACFPPHSGLTKHKVFTIGSKHVFFTSPSSPHGSHTDSPIHQFTNSPIHHGFTLTCTRGPRCFPSDRPSVNPLWGGHGLNELSLKASRSTNSFRLTNKLPLKRTQTRKTHNPSVRVHFPCFHCAGLVCTMGSRVDVAERVSDAAVRFGLAPEAAPFTCVRYILCTNGPGPTLMYI